MTTEQTSIAELLSVGITLTAGEAVAIARALLSHQMSSEHGESQHGPVLPQNVCLGPDGSVACRDCVQAPGVAALARFLRELLPAGTAGIPGGLRYAVARALQEVDAPPFDSVEEFSAALARFEHGDGAQVLIELFERAQTSARSKSLPTTERRRTTLTTVHNLRSALHEADASFFEQKLAMERLTKVRTGKRIAIAASLIAAAALGAAGEATHRRFAAPTSPLLTQGLTMPVDTTARAAQPADIELEAPVGHARVSASQSTAKPTLGVPDRTQGKGTMRRGSRFQRPDDSGGILKRLRLRWLRKAFTGRT